MVFFYAGESGLEPAAAAGWEDGEISIAISPLGMGRTGDLMCSLYSMLLLCCLYGGGADTKALVSTASSVIINLKCIRRLTYC